MSFHAEHADLFAKLLCALFILTILAMPLTGSLFELEHPYHDVKIDALEDNMHTGFPREDEGWFDVFWEEYIPRMPWNSYKDRKIIKAAYFRALDNHYFRQLIFERAHFEKAGLGLRYSADHPITLVGYNNNDESTFLDDRTFFFWGDTYREVMRDQIVADNETIHAFAQLLAYSLKYRKVKVIKSSGRHPKRYEFKRELKESKDFHALVNRVIAKNSGTSYAVSAAFFDPAEGLSDVALLYMDSPASDFFYDYGGKTPIRPIDSKQLAEKLAYYDNLEQHWLRALERKGRGE
jgi:hypothetical protein